jgi:methyl-accepting chemotaxis protein
MAEQFAERSDELAKRSGEIAEKAEQVAEASDELAKRSDELAKRSEEIAEERVNKERQIILARKNAAICGPKRLTGAQRRQKDG